MTDTQKLSLSMAQRDMFAAQVELFRMKELTIQITNKYNALKAEIEKQLGGAINEQTFEVTPDPPSGS